MAERIKVLQLIKELNVGGAERLVALLARVGDRDRFEYSVAHALSDRDDLVESLQADRIPVHDLGGKSQIDLRWTSRLRSLLAEERYDVVHLHLPYTAGLGRLVAWSLGPTRRPGLVQTQHDVWDRTRWPTRSLSRVTWWMDDVDLVVSQVVKDSLPRRLAATSSVMLHGIDLAEMQSRKQPDETRREFGVTANELLVVTVANLRRQKAYEILLAAAAVLLFEGLPVRFVAVGHGPLEAEVREEHQRLGLGDRFVLTGMRSDVADILAAADVFVLASHHEGFPLAVMEALAVGVPVIATAVGEIPRVVRPGIDGLLVPPGDSEALASALRAVIVDPDLLCSLTSAARETGGRFDIRRASARLEEIYTDLASKRSRRR